MSGGLLKELHARTHCVCLLRLAISDQAGASLPEGAIHNVMTSIFYGNDKNGADSDLITYVNQFMLGLNKFKGL